MAYVHGSSEELPVGTVLTPRGEDYERQWASTDFYAALEVHRPTGFLAHKDAVFMVADADDIDLAGGGTEWAFEVEPVGPVTKHDLNWSSEISCLIGDGHAPDSEPVKQAALNYWNGIPHHDENVWEYLAGSARISRVEPYETYGMAP